MADSQHIRISFENASALGLKHYFNEKPCKRGHLGKRLVSTRSCCECLYIGLKAKREADRETARRIDREWKDKNRERIRANDRARYEKNPEKHRAKARKQYWENPDRAKTYSRIRHHEIYKIESIRKEAAERTRKWSKENPEKVKVNARNGKAKRKLVPGKHTAADIREIKKLQRSCCALCRTKLGNKYHVDHIAPVAKGGTNDRKNLQLLCEPCNLAKAARDPIDHMQSLGFLL